jgi:hypothetical protein
MFGEGGPSNIVEYDVNSGFRDYSLFATHSHCGRLSREPFRSDRQTSPPNIWRGRTWSRAVEFEADERHANPMGTLYGGVLYDMANAATGMLEQPTEEERKHDEVGT